ncbi:MAG: RNA polymerase sigma-70 factor [Bacteroidetes bacterium HGW-Bacteroidetes-7]|jgi:RNA polymerase sigma-70 factor (ECF subfamily)|nr:MAG: RNA polymerase sigma-70 factor [Bacteroidetes bacterium HGW-Bacteroidetes-7]
MINDLFLFKKIKEGNIETFEKVFKENYSPLLYYSAGITGRIEVAEEIIQELFYQIWKDREKINILSSLKGYLYSAVKNRSLQYCERLRNENNYKESIKSAPLSTSGHSPQENLEASELEGIIKQTMDKMPERRLKIFKMHRFENRRYAEIAQNLSVSVKTVEAEMTKALKALRKDIEYYTSLL